MQETTAVGDISHQLKTQQDEEVANNRYLFRAVLHEIDFFARVNSALRGGDEKSGRLEVPQDESSIDFTQGNLRAALQKRCVFDQKLASIVSTCSHNATFLSPGVQNRIIGCAATMLLRDVTAPVHDAGPFSVIADGTSEISRCEQLSVTLRYENGGCIDEVFVGFVPMTVQNAEAVATAIKQKLVDLGLDLRNIVGQGYDGASVMSGRENGVQALIRRDYPNALFVHCQSHCLNLSIRSSCNVQEVQAVHTTIADVCNHFAHSSVRTFQLSECVEQKNDAGEMNTVLKCVRLSRLLAFECTLNHCTFISFISFHFISTQIKRDQRLTAPLALSKVQRRSLRSSSYTRHYSSTLNAVERSASPTR